MEYLEILHPKTQKRENEGGKFSEKKKKGANFTTISKPNQKNHMMEKIREQENLAKTTMTNTVICAKKRLILQLIAEKIYRLEKSGKFFLKITFVLTAVKRVT